MELTNPCAAELSASIYYQFGAVQITRNIYENILNIELIV